MATDPPDGASPEPPYDPPLDPESTAHLLSLVRSGDSDALNEVMRRCLPRLLRWAHGRLPDYLRDSAETADVVQDTLMAALRRIDHFEARREGALLAYLRQALQNRITDLARQRRRRPESTDIPEDLAGDDTSPLDHAIGMENAARYEAALLRLRPEDREAIVNRVELHYSYEDLAIVLDKPTANAARVAVIRALRRLADEMKAPTR